jgi:pimeloyl-ACP methyl ester carboxylesterase
MGVPRGPRNLLPTCLIAVGFLLGAASAHASVVDIPVHFQVANVNRSAVPCTTDGRPYRVSGELVAPDSVLAEPNPAVTLYVHGLGFARFFWHFQSLSGYDYATQQAEAGHASVVIDSLGYGASGHPPGTLTCIGAQADVAHQVIHRLRSGKYDAGGEPGVPFDRIVLAGHSLGGAIVKVEAYSFHDADGLIVAADAEQSSPRAVVEVGKTSVVCAMGGEPSGPGGAGPGGYAPFGQTAAAFRQLMFNTASPSVQAAVTPLRTLNPCGEIMSIPTTLAVDQLELGSITGPVLLECAAADAIFPQSSCTGQASLFKHADVTTHVVPGAGHALTFEGAHEAFRRQVATWLDRHGF